MRWKLKLFLFNIQFVKIIRGMVLIKILPTALNTKTKQVYNIQ